MQPIKPAESHSHDVRTYLQLTWLLDGIGKDHPEVSAPLRLTLFRARRDGHIGSLDQDRFRIAAAQYSSRIVDQQTPVAAAP